MLDKNVIREIIVDFHERKLPPYTRRMVDLACPQNKIRCLQGVRRSGKTFAFYQLRRNLDRSQVFYYKTSGGEEIDFLTVERGVVTNLIQVCDLLTDRETRKREIGALLSAMQELDLSEAVIITHNSNETLSDTGKTIRVIPFYAWALEQN